MATCWVQVNSSMVGRGSFGVGCAAAVRIRGSVRAGFAGTGRPTLRRVLARSSPRVSFAPGGRCASTWRRVARRRRDRWASQGSEAGEVEEFGVSVVHLVGRLPDGNGIGAGGGVNDVGRDRAGGDESCRTSVPSTAHLRVDVGPGDDLDAGPPCRDQRSLQPLEKTERCWSRSSLLYREERLGHGVLVCVADRAHRASRLESRSVSCRTARIRTGGLLGRRRRRRRARGDDAGVSLV